VLGVGVGAYLLFKNTRLALISSAIWAVIPYSVFFERLSLADAMLTMFILWTFNLLILAFEKSRLDFAMLAGFTLGFAYLTKSPAVFYNILLPILIILVPRNQLSKKYLLISAALFAATTIIALGMYNILRLGPEFHQIALRTADYVHPLSDVLPHPLDPLIPHLKDTLSFLFYLLTPVGLLFVFWGMYESHKDHVSKRLVLVVLSLVPILAMSFIAKAFTARYLFFTAPFLVMLMSHGLDHLGQKTQKHILTYLGCIAVCLPSLLIDYLLLTNPERAPLPRIERSGYLEEWTAGFGIKEISQYIKTVSQSGPVLVGSEGFFGTPFSALEMYLNQVPQVRITGIGLDVSSTPDKLKTATKDNQVFMVVNSTRFSGNPQDPEFSSKWGLKLISSYPKSTRPDNTKEFLYLFQVINQ
jgi:hypothetical protein